MPMTPDKRTASTKVVFRPILETLDENHVKEQRYVFILEDDGC
jgi:hypothetical protein